VTNTHFEGLAERNPLAQRGYSRDHRPDCKQVCISLVETREGMPVSYEVFADNRTDVTTVEEIVEQMEERYRLAQRIWVMDRGMTSAENLEWLQQTGRRYLLGTAKANGASGRARSPTPTTGRACAREWRPSSAPDPRARRRWCGAARWNAASRGSLSASRSSSGRLDRIGMTGPGTAKAATYSNLTDWDAEQLLRTYIQLSEAVAAFRIHKSELAIRPIWHQREDRVQAHILKLKQQCLGLIGSDHAANAQLVARILRPVGSTTSALLVCFLAYVLWKTLEQWQSRAGRGQQPAPHARGTGTHPI
jgi:hypothetical protein